MEHRGNADVGLGKEVPRPKQNFPAPSEWQTEALSALPTQEALGASRFLPRTEDRLLDSL